MRTSFASLAVVAGLLALAGGQAAAAGTQSSLKTVSVVMHDPGCHWFAVGGKYVKTLTVKGPVALANYDENTLIVAGPSGVKHDPIMKKITLQPGTYTINMVKQAHDDNTLKLVVR
jgi:hypothetical protein